MEDELESNVRERASPSTLLLLKQPWTLELKALAGLDAAPELTWLILPLLNGH